MTTIRTRKGWFSGGSNPLSLPGGESTLTGFLLSAAGLVHDVGRQSVPHTGQAVDGSLAKPDQSDRYGSHPRVRIWRQGGCGLDLVLCSQALAPRSSRGKNFVKTGLAFCTLNISPRSNLLTSPSMRYPDERTPVGTVLSEPSPMPITWKKWAP